MASHDQDPELDTGGKNKIRRTREHATGIIVPRWWNRTHVIVIAVAAVISVVFSVLTLDKASERVTVQQNSAEDPSKPSSEGNAPVTSGYEPPPELPLEAVAKRFPAPEKASVLPVQTAGAGTDDGLASIYEEPLPGDLYEDAPVIPDATGPRVVIQDEVIPYPGRVDGKTDVDGRGASENVPAAITTEKQDLAALDTPVLSDNPGTATFGKIKDTSNPGAVPDKSDLSVAEYLPYQQQAWLTNALPFFASKTGLPDDAPMIAIVIDDMGVDRRRSSRAIELPGPLTLSFLTYAKDITGQTRTALEAGHELMAHIPMEPGSTTVDPGPNVLRVADNVTLILDHLRWGLSQFSGYVGINNHMGSKFTSDDMGMRAVLQEIKNRGLLFLDSRTSGNSVAAKIAGELGVPFATRNVFLDHVDEAEEIRKQLGQTERLARKNGAVVAIGHPHDKTLEALEAWLPTLSGKGMMLVPMSELVRRTWLKEQQERAGSATALMP